MKRGMIFIDGSNVFYDWHTVNPGKKMDIEKYVGLIKSYYPDVEFKRAYYFTSETATNHDFLSRVNKMPYMEVKRGRLQSKTIDLSKSNVICQNCGDAITLTITTQIDKGTDVNIAVEMLKHAFNGSYDFAVLASRDADFCSVVRIVKDLGKNVELLLFDGVRSFAQELTDNVDKVKTIPFSDYPNCEL